MPIFPPSYTFCYSYETFFYFLLSYFYFFFFSSRRRHTRWTGDWSSDVCSSDLAGGMMFVLVRTSNPGGADIQELELADGSRVWEHVARIVASLAPVAGAVVGATQPGAVARRSEGRRVGKGGRCGGGPGDVKKKE